MKAQDLKNSILQLAIQGKLVEQREEEGTAKELIEKIKAEKEKLIKEKKTKKTKPLPEIAEDEKPFDIPESWEWSRLESVTYSIGNKTNQIKQSEILQEGLYPVVSQSMNRIEGYSNEEGKLLKINPLSVIVFGDHSKTLKLIDFDFVIGADGTKIMVPILIDPEYLFYVLTYNAINMRDRGYSRHFQFLKEILIPLPPLVEQKRIVAKIEELLPYVEKYDKAYTEVEELNKKFPENMQKSILQYAIQGKLVEQRKEDGTAEELYQQIQEEKQKLIKEGKIKKTKPLPEITEDEIPFDIPENWKWVRLGEIGEIVGGGTPKTGNSEFWNGGNIPWLTPADMKFVLGKYVENGERFITEKGLKDSSARLMPKGTIIYSSRAPIGYIAIANNNLATNQGFKSLVPYELRINEYMYYCLISRTNEIISRASGTTFKEISGSEFGLTVVPLPPLAEQKRIVEKIEELLPYTKQLVKKID